MTRRTSTLLRVLPAAALILAAASCNGDGDGNGEVLPVVAITGSHSVDVGGTLALTVATQNGVDSSYAWASENESIATVDENGTVTGVAAGETTITAAGADTGAVGMHALVVGGRGGNAVVVVSGDFLVAVGETTALTAETVNGNDSGYAWSSADESVATVDEAGTVTGVAAGEVIITARGADTGRNGAFGMVVSDSGFDPTDVPHYAEWLGSGHADRAAEAFNHWNEEDPPEISTSCAKCHSTPGFRDFIGDDGTEAGAVDNPAPIGTVIECQACHNATAMALSSVVFPSGVELTGLGPEARCMTCHQGRESTVSVNQRIADAAVVDDDTPDEDLSFRNIHYFAAGATLNAGLVQGGYQYEGNVYDVRNRHVPGFDSCTGCHNPHSLELKLEACGGCHTGVTTVEDTHAIRMMSSLASDYDGDGNLDEGLYDEIEGLKAVLLTAIGSYTEDKGLPAICYDAHSHPYWFIDTDGSGDCSAEEAVSDNGYDSWTARLVRATYNYQVSMKDPGGFAHNGKYMIQLLYDSIADLNLALTTPVDLSSAARTDHGHFDGSSEAYRHWDEDGAVSASCAKCHGGAEGFHFYLEYGVGKEVEVANGMDCAACHSDLSTFETVAVDEVLYPSGITIEDEGNVSNMCATCHSGRESKATVDARIASGSLSFRNVHYLPAASVLSGTDAKVGYEFDGMTYSGAASHTAGTDCTFCHSPSVTNHTFQVADNLSSCTGCHSGVDDPQDIRLAHTEDYDADGSSSEPLADEIKSLAEDLLVEMQVVAGTDGNPICYEGHSHPYFFYDTDSDGECSETEAISDNAFDSWTPDLLRTSFNYQLSQKEPGAWAHNFDYMVQLLVDSIEVLGGDVSAYVRPAAE